ncbi:3-keto-5-aminohexanoate cleavage protein [Shimia sp.]|uniref:3-keto-5-aminohexanoate cleavage protein n=1 Tax=Shimia sp. TaxID=1954381 RepID=UPI00329A7F03
MTHPIIMVAPNGARRDKADHPALPLTLPEILQTAQACHAAGAQALHLHVRDDTGTHSLDAGRYREALDELAHSVPTMRVQITTEAAGIYDVAQQLACLEQVRPGWASISVRETLRNPDLAPRIYAACADMGCDVQHILYDTDDIALLTQLMATGIVRPDQSSVLFVLGRYSAGQTSNPSDLDPFLNALPDVANWMLCAFGPREHACLAHAAQKGGNLRVGFENSLVTADGSPHTDNAASVTSLIQLLERRRS